MTQPSVALTSAMEELLRDNVPGTSPNLLDLYSLFTSLCLSTPVTSPMFSKYRRWLIVSANPKMMHNKSVLMFQHTSQQENSIQTNNFLFFLPESGNHLTNQNCRRTRENIRGPVLKGKGECSISKNNLFIAGAIYQQEMVWCLNQVTNHSELFIWGEAQSCYTT